MWTQVLSWIFDVLIVAVVAVYFILKIAVPKLVRSAVDYQFSKKLDAHRNELAMLLEDHKHQLQQITLSETHNYQRLIRDFDLFTTKRHEIYPELYRQILKAHDIVRSLLGGDSKLTFDGYSYEDIEQYLFQIKRVPKQTATLLLDLWKNEELGRQQAIKEIKNTGGA